MPYEILGYDRINGDKTYKKMFKPNIVNSISDIDEFERKVKKRYEKCHPTETVEIYTVYRIPIKEHIPVPKNDVKTHTKIKRK